MKLAPLQLIDYFITELTLKANPDFDTTKPADDGVDALIVTPQYALTKDNGEHGTDWLVVLEISQTIAEGANLPYAFALRIQGTVAASPHLTGTRLQRTMHANGPTMLFGAAREIIRAATGRGPWPAVIIPSTNFLIGLPPLEQNPEVSEKVAPSNSAPNKKKAAKKSSRKKS